MEESKRRKKKKESPFEPKGVSGTVYVLLHDVACILAAITFLFVFAARLVGVSGSSMYPTLVGGEENRSNGDYLVLQSNFLCSGYENGDIVVACLPQFQNGKPIVKRVIATGGQKISFVSDGVGGVRVCVDGVELDEPYINHYDDERYRSGDSRYVLMEERGIGTAGSEYVVPKGGYFLMGDNRNNSTDSRVIGVVDERYILGKALLVALPGQDAANGSARDWGRFGAIYGD